MHQIHKKAYYYCKYTSRVYLNLLLFGTKLVDGNRIAGTGLRMCVVRRPTRSLLCVLLLSPLGTQILKPNLFQMNAIIINIQLIHKIKNYTFLRLILYVTSGFHAKCL